MEEFVEISMLYDFYGSFLTEKQKEAVELYYNMNYSLGEIGEKMHITRQGVRDLLIRSKELLHSFDEKLGLVDKYRRQQDLLQKQVEQVDILLSQLADETLREPMEQLRDGLLRLMDDV